MGGWARWAAGPCRNCTRIWVCVSIAPCPRGWNLSRHQLARVGTSVRTRELRRSAARSARGVVTAFGSATITGADQVREMRDRAAAATREVSAIAPFGDALDRQFGELRRLTYPAQRVHGDFHLGQTLLAGSHPGDESWRIIDFEGEPLKGLDERRVRDTPWRDVAGMLRSLAYAGAYAERNEGVSPAYADAWVATAGAAFVKAYAGHPLSTDEQVILRCHQLDKAVYECSMSRATALTLPPHSPSRAGPPADERPSRPLSVPHTDRRRHDMSDRVSGLRPDRRFHSAVIRAVARLWSHV